MNHAFGEHFFEQLGPMSLLGNILTFQRNS